MYQERPTLRQVQVTDPFWSDILNRSRTVTLPDVIQKFIDGEKGSVLQNFRARAASQNHHLFTAWHDGLFYEVITAASDFLILSPDPDLEAQLDSFIHLIAAAQAESGDGYLSTFTQAVAPHNRFGTNGGNALVQHDLYNMGCLIEAGAHHYLATGKTNLLVVAVRTAEYLCDVIGEPPLLAIVPGHSMIETTLLEFYELFDQHPEAKAAIRDLLGKDIDEARYRDLSLFFLDHRGKHADRPNCPAYLSEYAQDHLPLTEQKEAVGHAVRAMLLYEGMTASVRLCDREAYRQSALALWNNVVTTKLHISGGVGAMSFQENFGYQYQLPEDAYLETCAGVALMLWAGEMSRLDENGAYFDVWERTFYNNVLSGVSLDGTHYFYQNPLKSAGDIERWSWHDCPCCPPMLLKILAEMPRYIYSVSEDSVRIELHVDSQLTTDAYRIGMKDNDIRFEGDTRHMTLKIRIPEYHKNHSFFLNKKPISPEVISGYAIITRTFESGDTITYSADEEPFRIQAHPYSDEIYGRTAFQKGPFLYCAEGIDNGNRVDFVIATDAPLREQDHCLRVSDVSGQDVTLIPYYMWNNRGKCPMSVWFPAPGLICNKLDLSEWKGRLYRFID